MLKSESVAALEAARLARNAARQQGNEGVTAREFMGREAAKPAAKKTAAKKR